MNDELENKIRDEIFCRVMALEEYAGLEFEKTSNDKATLEIL